MTLEFTYTLKELNKIANVLLDNLDSKVVLFRGTMGSGKTTLIKAMTEAMGSTEITSSPSFSLVNEYSTNKGTVYHFDLFRIEHPSEIWDIGFEDYLNSDNWLFIEWPEQIIEAIPSDYNEIEIDSQLNTSRSLKLTINKRTLTETIVMTD